MSQWQNLATSLLNDVINEQRLVELYQQHSLIKQAHPCLSFNTLEIRPNYNNQIPAKSIIIDQQYGIIITNETTRILINKLATLVLFNRLVNSYIRNYFNYHLPHNYHLHDRLPLVMGNWCFLPLNSHCHRCAVWIALHHLKNYDLHHSQLALEYTNGICTQFKHHCSAQRFDNYVHEAQCMQQQIMQWIEQLNQLVQRQTKPCQPYKCQQANCPRCRLINEQLTINQLKNDWLNQHYQGCLDICHQIGLDHWYIDMFKYHYHQKYFKHRNFD